MKEKYNTFEDFENIVKTYISNPSSLALMKKAYDFAADKHKNQFRKSGEAYIIHPLNVSCILANLHVGPDTICAGFLHDVVEDTDVTLDVIKKEFNEDIASIVDGVTKVTQLSKESNNSEIVKDEADKQNKAKSDREEKQILNHQHILLAMAKDIRVILVKLADRLHNMRTLGAMPQEKQVRIARETLDVYAPLAHKLGMFVIKGELEDLSLMYLEPQEYHKVLNLVKNDTQARVQNINRVIDDIKKILNEENIKDFTIKGRVKSTYSIYKKMKNQNKAFNEIYDILAIRIIVDTIPLCYQVFGLIHAHYTPLPQRIKDYIAVPKPNMYQSLHTTVISRGYGNDSSEGFKFEVQIRTKEMDEIDELGVAAHWAYKENKSYDKDKEQYEIAQKLKWYADLLNYSEEEKSDAKEYVASVKEDILSLNVYVITPTGEVIDLPRGATPIDFAFAIHTRVGETMIGASVNDHIVPMDYELKTGDVCSIKTSKNSFGPTEAWLKLCKTKQAKRKINTFINKKERDSYVSHGKETLDEEFKNNRIVNYVLSDEFASDGFSKNNIKNLEDLYYAVGRGIISTVSVVRRYMFLNHIEDEETEDEIQKRYNQASKKIQSISETGVIVEGLSNPELHLGNCCNPIPGDNIVGYVTKGNGIVVHRKDCKNLNSFDKQRLISLSWAKHIERRYQCAIKITGKMTNSITVDIVNTCNTSNMTVLGMNLSTNAQTLGTIVKLKVSTENKDDLDKLIIKLKMVKDVYNIERDNG